MPLNAKEETAGMHIGLPTTNSEFGTFIGCPEE